MTTYSAIANSEIAVGAPVTNSLMTKLRDNPLAIQENDASAPTVAYSTTSGTATNFSGSLSGDVTGTQGATVVGDDTHNHGNTTIAANAIRDTHIYWENTSTSSQLITLLSSWTVPAGLYFGWGTQCQIEHFLNSGWRSSGAGLAGTFYSDGTNTRIYNADGSGSQTFYYIKLA